jgi:D-beta-D-heptose 7-phosphate kinase/D-beta-D-heptose 1-phosphate adenosyltransferase
LINYYDGIIFSNYAKGTITQPIADRVIAAAQRQGVITAADPKPKSGIQFARIDLLKPNRSEALEMVGASHFNGSEICRSIFAKHRPKYLVITLGQEGMLIARDGEVVNSPRELSSEKLERRPLLPKKSCKLAFRRLKKYYF